MNFNFERFAVETETMCVRLPKNMTNFIRKIAKKNRMQLSLVVRLLLQPSIDELTRQEKAIALATANPAVPATPLQSQPVIPDEELRPFQS